MNPTYHTDLESPNDMLVDSDELLNDAENEKDDGNVHDIHPDDTIPLADDLSAMSELALPPLSEQPEILETVTNTWEITNWNSLPRRHRGPIFWCGGHPWRVLMFPKGNNVDWCSFYLEHGYGEETQPMPENFSCCVQFGLVLWNPNAPSCYAVHTAHHRFTKDEGDWGFTRFVELRKLWNVPWNAQGDYMAPDEKANLTAYVRHVKDETGVLWHNFQNYDSKQETGYVGLKNQGATCYLNSLLQSLYFTNAFRKAVYQIPTQNEETLSNSAYTLQRLFYQLQTSNNAVGTSELTKSFGWETRHIFEQQDVQELSRKLMERMEEKMKGTEAEKVLPKLFSGKVRTYISCINVQYESRRVEDFWDIQLNVSGNKDLEASFRDYIEVEIMNGENQYMAGDEFKLQDAEKGVIFESFPDVLHLQLKRFQYDIERDAMMKINDRYEFPETFDASPYLSSDADTSEPYIYQLHGVLVHSGDLNAGHYYAFIKPEKDGWFYKYDDDKVTKATLREVLEDNYGGEYILPNGQVAVRGKTAKPILRQNSAYMLVYIRQTRLDEVLLPVTKEDTPPHLQSKLDEEARIRELRKKEREEQHLYLNARVITDSVLQEHGGIDLAIINSSETGIPGVAVHYRVLRKSTLNELIIRVGKDTRVDPRRIRMWAMVGRQNKTVRPDQPIHDSDVTIEEAYQKLAGTKTGEFRLWAEVSEEVDAAGNAIWPASPGLITNGTLAKSDLIVLFLKHFDIQLQKLTCIGYVYISKEKKVEELLPIILKKMGWPERNSAGDRMMLRLFEEIKPSMIEPMKGKQTLKAAELQDGDIVCFQLQPPGDGRLDESSLVSSKSNTLLSRSSTSDRSMSVSSDKSSIFLHTPSLRANGEYFDDARHFYDWLLHKKDVKFIPHPYRIPNPENQKEFTLPLSSKHSYDQMAARVGNYIGIDPTHLRFWSVHATNNQPKQPIRRAQTQNVNTILSPPYGTFNSGNTKLDTLFYEVLEMSLSELDTKKALKVLWLSEGISKEETFDILVPKNGTVYDLTQALIKKAQIEDESTGGPIRVYEVHGGKIYKELHKENQVLAITDYVGVVAERVPPEDVLPKEDSRWIQAFHFQNEPSKSHSTPFIFRVLEQEKFSETKKRLEKRTGFKGKNFEKIKFALVKQRSISKPTYLNDDDILDELLSPDDPGFLGLDHADRKTVRTGAGDLFLK